MEIVTEFGFLGKKLDQNWICNAFYSTVGVGERLEFFSPRTIDFSHFSYNIVYMSKELERRNALIHDMGNALRDLGIRATCSSVRVENNIAIFDICPTGRFKISQISRNLVEIGLFIKARSTPKFTVNSKSGVINLYCSVGERVFYKFEDLFFNVDHNSSDSLIPIILGVDEDGKDVIFDLAKNVHTLVAGASGSGKSILLHNIVSNIIMTNIFDAGEEIDLYIIDPKDVEFGAYLSGPTSDYICDVIGSDLNEIMTFLRKAETEMNRRYKIMSYEGCRDFKKCSVEMNPIVIIIDEFADIAMNDESGEFLSILAKIAQKSRAAGIFLVIATQRPSADVISGVIKANFSSRISCKTSSSVDSRIILGISGAEKLLGMGDAIIDNYCNSFNGFQIAYASYDNLTKFIQEFLEEEVAEL